MFTQTAIAAAITTMGTLRDPLKYVADISGVVAHHSSVIKRGHVDISDVLKMASNIKAIFVSIDADNAELQEYVDEANAENFTISVEDARKVVGSLMDLSNKINSAVKTLDNLRLIVSHLGTFYPHQKLVDSALMEGINKYSVMQQGISSIVAVCEAVIRKALKEAEVVTDDKARFESLRKEKFERALSRAAANNYATLRALADR